MASFASAPRQTSKRRRVVRRAPPPVFAELRECLERGNPTRSIAAAAALLRALQPDALALLRGGPAPVVGGSGGAGGGAGGGAHGSAATGGDDLLGRPPLSCLTLAIIRAAPTAAACARLVPAADVVPDADRALRQIEDALVDVVHAWADAGLSVDQAGYGFGDITTTPLVEAARLGLVSTLAALLARGASPDLSDGSGETALHAAATPTTSNAGVLHERQRRTLLFLVDPAHGWVTARPGVVWRAETPPGRLIHIDSEERRGGSSLYAAVHNKNTALATLLVGAGAALTDADYARLAGCRKKREEVRRLLPLVLAVARGHGVAAGGGAAVAGGGEAARAAGAAAAGAAAGSEAAAVGGAGGGRGENHYNPRRRPTAAEVATATWCATSWRPEIR